MKLKSFEECELLLVNNGWEMIEGGMWHKGNLYGFSESLLTDSSDYCKDTFLAKFCPFLLEEESESEAESWKEEAEKLDDLCLSHERLNAELQAKLVDRGNEIIKLKKFVTYRGEVIRSLQNVIVAKDKLIAKKELSRKEWSEVAIHHIRGGK